VVNWVWQEAFGEPLVPSEFLEDSAEGNARRELLDFLATQWTAHGESLPVLVGWISATTPWLLAEEPILPSSRLLEPDDLKRDRLTRKRLFASWSPGDQEADSIPMAQLDRWLEHASENSSSDLASRQRLAQPATSLAPSTLSPSGKQELPPIFASIDQRLELLDAPAPEVKGSIRSRNRNFNGINRSTISCCRPASRPTIDGVTEQADCEVFIPKMPRVLCLPYG
jgi:hypothetical protein